MVEEDEDESPHIDTDETDEEAQDIGPAFDNDLDSDVVNVIIEKDDHVFMMMVHPVNPHHFVCALSMVSRRLAEASAKNSKLKGFELRIFTSQRQDDWDDFLPLGEFQYNNSKHSLTQQTPFMVDTGRHPLS
jgi:hypothetical protein